MRRTATLALLASVLGAWPASAQPTPAQPTPGEVRWASEVTLFERHSRYWHAEPLGADRVLNVAGAALGRDVDVLLRLRVYAPGITDTGAADRDAVGRALSASGLRVESPWLSSGSAALAVIAVGVGPYGNDAEVEWSLADRRPGAAPPRAPTGRYPVRLCVGTQVLAALTLAWEADPSAGAPPSAPAPTAALPTATVVRAEVLHRERTAWHAQPLERGASLSLSGARRREVDLVIRLHVVIPGVTDDRALAPDGLRAALRPYAPQVRSAWVEGGLAPLVVRGRATGPSGDEAVLEWSAFAYDNGQGRSVWPSSGRYGVTFSLAGSPAFEVELDWTGGPSSGLVGAVDR